MEPSKTGMAMARRLRLISNIHGYIELSCNQRKEPPMLRFFVAGLMVGVAALAADLTSAPASVTFHRDVLPILQKNCQGCHRPGEVAPMSLLTYADARPWAKAIKTAVVSKKMPPWFADPQYGHFANDRRLSDAQINTLVAWANNGAPEGNTKDAPPPL